MRQEWSRSFLIIAVPSLLCLPLPLSYIKQINILMPFTYYPIIGIVTVPVILTFFLNLTFFLIVPVLFCLQKHLQFAIPTTLLPAVGLNKVRYLKLCSNDVIIIISHKYTIRRVRVIMMIREMNFVLLRDLVKKVACLSLRLRHPGGM